MDSCAEVEMGTANGRLLGDEPDDWGRGGSVVRGKMAVSSSNHCLENAIGVIRMGTRLLSEAMIKRHHPHIRYVRVHTSGRNAVAIYAWNESLELPEPDRVRLQRFAAGYMPPYLCCQVKAYSEIQADQVPHVPDRLPEAIMQAAMDRALDPPAVLALINGMLTDGELMFERYDGWTGTMHFAICSGGKMTGVERELLHQYLYEVVPLGTYFEVNYIV